MAPRAPLLETLTLRGLELAPPQVWGGIRLVPLLREHVREDLRLAKRSYDEDAMVVSLEGELLAPGPLQESGAASGGDRRSSRRPELHGPAEASSSTQARVDHRNATAPNRP